MGNGPGFKVQKIYTASSAFSPQSQEHRNERASHPGSFFVSKKDRFGLKGNTIAGTFRVDEVVAEGGFGVVYRAFHLHFRSPVALKCLKIPGELSESERGAFLEQFRSEAEIQFRLSASLPNIVRPLHVDAVTTKAGDFVPLMALEWLEGQSFEKIIERRNQNGEPAMPLDQALELISPAAQALHEAHNIEIDGERVMVVHRDIKPDNLFVTEIGGRTVVKLLDFGISKVRRAASELASHASQADTQAPFSPAYGAPEQWAPKHFGPTGPWTDVWGLALTLVEIIKGDAVIVGDHQEMMGTALDSKIRPTPRNEGVEVSDEVESVFQKALSLEPRYRYQSIQSFWDALSAAIALAPSADVFDETPSGRRIPLPAMRPPTPWTPPHRHLHQAEPIGHLPPMLAPAPLQPTTEEELVRSDSDIRSISPPAWADMESSIPPISDEHDLLPADMVPLETPHIAPVTEQGQNHLLHREVVLQIELQPTSAFPEAHKGSAAWDDFAALAEDQQPGERPDPRAVVGPIPELELPRIPGGQRAHTPNRTSGIPDAASRPAHSFARIPSHKLSTAERPKSPLSLDSKTSARAHEAILGKLDLVTASPSRMPPTPPSRRPRKTHPEECCPPSSSGTTKKKRSSTGL